MIKYHKNLKSSFTVAFCLSILFGIIILVQDFAMSDKVLLLLLIFAYLQIVARYFLDDIDRMSKEIENEDTES